MIKHQNTKIKFYQNLGKLFYAIAASDSVVREEEFNKLKELIKKDWFQTDIIDSDSMIEGEKAILNTFKWLNDDNEYDAETCYKSFISFKSNNKKLFNSNVNSLILKTVAKIAASFSGQNKSELIMLAKLNLEFKKHNNEK
ncbi:hypothetical protein FBALC1_06708 [Flavobacteriales bacterium ALC-1]|nr:hypothetical protein FBALC1_06708 [Flavobacteriales bacterium ALC-1]